MNETIQTILARRSVRSYESKPLSDEILDTIMNCGIWAPTAMNQQSPLIINIKDSTIIKELVNIGTKLSPRKSDPFYGAPHIILVFAQMSTHCPVQDAALAMENMMLAATSLGIGTCWINALKDILTTPDGQMLRKRLKITDDHQPIAALILGYPKDNLWPEPKKRKDNYCYSL